MHDNAPCMGMTSGAQACSCTGCCFEQVSMQQCYQSGASNDDNDRAPQRPA